MVEYANGDLWFALRGSASKRSRVTTGSVGEMLFPEEDRAGEGSSPGRVGHIGRDNTRFAAMSVSLRHCIVAPLQ